MEKKYLNWDWEKTVSDEYYDFVTDLINNDATTPCISGLGRQHTTSLDIHDCYYDEKGDLYTPTEYTRTYTGGFRDDSGVYQNEDEYYPEQYELFKSAKQLEEEFKIYQSEHK